MTPEPHAVGALPANPAFENEQKLRFQQFYNVPRNRNTIKDAVLGDKAQPRLNARKKRFPRWSTLNLFR